MSGGRVLLWVVMMMGVPALAWAQQQDYDGAVAAYQAADYDAAVDRFAALIKDPDVEHQILKASYQYLGRAYVAKNALDEARRVVRDLIALEPPIIEPDPEIEPPPLMELYYEIRKEHEGYVAQKRDGRMRTITVIDFTNGSVGEAATAYSALQQGLPSLMISHLSGATDLKVVERERIQWLLGELNLQRDPSRIDQSTAVEVGKVLGAHAVVIGSYIVNKRKIYLSARLVSVETSEVLFGEQLTGKTEDFPDLVLELSRKVAGTINTTLDTETLGSVGPGSTHSYDALMRYSEGLELLEKKAYQAAYDKFMEALEYDPSYAPARQRAESIRPLMG